MQIYTGRKTLEILRSISLTRVTRFETRASCPVECSSLEETIVYYVCMYTYNWVYIEALAKEYVHRREAPRAHGSLYSRDRARFPPRPSAHSLADHPPGHITRCEPPSARSSTIRPLHNTFRNRTKPLPAPDVR